MFIMRPSNQIDRDMDKGIKACVLNAHNDAKWYSKGSERLMRSLIHHGNTIDFVGLVVYPTKYGGWRVTGNVNGNPITPVTNERYRSDCPYTVKAAAFHWAREQGYDVILWLDCSVWAVKPIDGVLDHINHEGYYFWTSGYSIGQITGDHCLAYFGFTRDEAYNYPDCSSSMVGLKLSNPRAAAFLNEWLRSAEEGMWHGKRDPIQGINYDTDAKLDIQLVYHRQDQSAASCVIRKLGLKMWDPGVFSMYANRQGDYPDSVSLVMRGM